MAASKPGSLFWLLALACLLGAGQIACGPAASSYGPPLAEATEPSDCIDDGLGAGCAASPRCSDGAATLGSACAAPEAAPAPPCSDGVTRTCGYAQHLEGTHLECTVGSQTCKKNAWGPCVIEKFASDAS
jgi:hypothetical protein